MPWTEGEEREFVRVLYAIGELYNETVSTMRAEMFCQALEDLPFQSVASAARTHLKRSHFFPKPADLRELVEGTSEDEAALGWQWLVREVRRVGYLGTPVWPNEVTQHAAEGLFGSWRALCERLPADGPELLGFRKQFVSLFGAARRKASAGELGSVRAEAAALLADVLEENRRR
jgi:hypothetical protein